MALAIPFDHNGWAITRGTLFQYFSSSMRSVVCDGIMQCTQSLRLQVMRF